MKRIILGMVLLALFMLNAGKAAWAGEMDVLLNKLVEKGILSPAESQIIADETKIQVSKDLAQAKSLSVPEWTQRIKWGGDVRYRTQSDWGKKAQSDTPGGSFIKNQEWRNRIRGRFYLEGKVNDFTYAGARFAGGALKANSTNDTLQSYWNKNYAMFDQYYMRFEAPSEMIRNYGQYFSDLKLWAGRFPRSGYKLCLPGYKARHGFAINECI
ncbi:MAG: putative porin [Candidatus Omnitrophica bacterium]|nr:putative porin [Candidatus Omnitrophota bacterium]